MKIIVNEKRVILMKFVWIYVLLLEIWMVIEVMILIVNKKKNKYFLLWMER